MTPADIEPLQFLERKRVDFGRLWQLKGLMLTRAHARYRERGRPALPYGDFAAFRREHAAWLEPYAYFRALKDHYEGRPWWEWPDETRAYDELSDLLVAERRFEDLQKMLKDAGYTLTNAPGFLPEQFFLVFTR